MTTAVQIAISLLLNRTQVIERVYPQSFPQGVVYPAIRVYRSGGAPLYTDEGEAGLNNSRLVVEAFAITYGAAKDLAGQCRASLSDFEGEVDGVDVQAIFLDDERDEREGGSNSAEYVYIVSQSYQIWHGD